MSKTLMQLQSEKIRSVHRFIDAQESKRLSEIQEAQRSLDTLETDIKVALAEVLKTHGLKFRDLSLTLNMSAGDAPSMFDGKTAPSGWLSASLDVA